MKKRTEDQAKARSTKNQHPFLRPLMILTSLFLLSSCEKTMKFLQQEIKNYGHIPYTTPLQYAGPGTLVGGSPKKLSLIANPMTCFPDEIEGVPTNLRKLDLTTLPKKSYKMNISGSAKLKLFNILALGGGPSIGAGANISHVETVSLEMNGVHIEYIDAIHLTEFYRRSMTPICKEYLNQVGFIIQAIKVNELRFQFTSKNGGKVFLNLENLQNYIDLGAEASWSIEDSTTLVIDTPKYIGFQLGSLRQSENGMSLFRATDTKMGKFNFKSIYVFDKLDEELEKKKLGQKAASLHPTNAPNTPTALNALDDSKAFKTLGPSDLILEGASLFEERP